MPEDRAARRRRERAERKTGRPVAVLTDTGQFVETGRANKPLPPKAPGQHRWIATAAFALTEEWVRGAWDPAVTKYLDEENRFSLAIGCWDCEGQLAPPGTPGGIQAGSPCPAPASEVA